MRDLLHLRKCQSQSFLFIMALEVVEESTYVIGAKSEMKESKISVCSLPSAGLHALGFPKHIPIK
jgi:hypothetical protein